MTQQTTGTKVSLLTPVWNEERHVAEMIDSVLAQTHPTWELLLVDDGSTDRTAELITAAAAADERIRVLSTGVKLGKVGAFNLAAEHATGHILAHVGGDDTLPVDSLSARVQALAGHLDEPAVAFFKLRAFSQDAAFRPMVVPRGRHGSRSGPSITVTRPLARLVFPIPPELVSEDIWWGNASAAAATTVVHSPTVVTNYRVHPGNSNPRAKTFQQMTTAIHARMAAYPALLEQRRFAVPDRMRREFVAQCRAEEYRHHGKTLRLLGVRDLPVVDRLALMAMSDPLLWTLRTRFFAAFTGWRGR